MPRTNHHSRGHLRFGLIFAAVLLGFYVLYTLPAALRPRRDLRCGTARAASFLLNRIRVPNAVHGDTIALGGAAGNMKIIDECTALFALFVYFAFVSAFPSSLRSKALGVVVGAALLLSVNLARIVAAGVLLRSWPSLFAPIHDYVWQLGFMAVTLGSAAAWSLWVVGRPVPSKRG